MTSDEIKRAVEQRRKDVEEANAHYKRQSEKYHKHHLNKTAAKDYSQTQQALYTPALSKNYVDFINSGKSLQTKVAFSSSDMNFLNTNSKLFNYPYALYSAGQAATSEKDAKIETWVTKKNRTNGSIVLNDSGGYQIQGNKIEFKGDDTCERSLRWMEANGEYSMILDFPTGGIKSGALRQHIKRLEKDGIDVTVQAKKEGFSPDFMACLIQTEMNNQYFQANRIAGATKLLNVMQGRNERESKFWYERMRNFPFEGITFADKHSVKFSMTLRRILQMLDDGLLKKCEWIHFLGVSTFRTAAILSCIQEELRFHPNAHDDLQITFDSASGSLATAFGYNAYIGYDFDYDVWRFKQHKISILEYMESDLTLNEICVEEMRKKDKSPFTNLPSKTKIGDLIKPKDLLVMGKDKNGDNRVSMTTEGGFFLMNHNMEALVNGFEKLNDLMAQDIIEMPSSILVLKMIIRAIINPRNEIDYHEIDLVKDKLAETRHSKRVQNHYISLLKTDPLTMLNEAAHLLDAVAMKVD